MVWKINTVLHLSLYLTKISQLDQEANILGTQHMQKIRT